jgi:hypothetical protein
MIIKIKGNSNFNLASNKKISIKFLSGGSSTYYGAKTKSRKHHIILDHTNEVIGFHQDEK